MFRKIIKALLPRETIATLTNYKILSVGFGQYRTIKRWDCVDAKDAPVPWYTYPAVEYLKQLELSDKTIFEYGSGNSTCFWAGRCKKIVSVEDDREWYDKIKKKLPENVDYHLMNEREEYIKSIHKYDHEFDIVIIDGSHRFECAVEAISKLRNDGFVILDNSDWKEKTSQLLREADLIEVDMSGFGPINDYTWTTSFYFRRNVKLTPAHDRQPIHGIGSLAHRET